eukprot:COSAG02_NODE_2889_length_7801_cov_2.407114_3_plen_179_part_00
MDHDLHFFTMSLTEWKFFVSELGVTGHNACGITQRQIRQSFWRAQGSFAPEHGSAAAMKEREDFLQKLNVTSEEDVSLQTHDWLIHNVWETVKISSGSINRQGADDGNLQEMNYVEFVEGVARLAFQMYTNQQAEGEESSTGIDYSVSEVLEAMRTNLMHIIDKLKELIRHGRVQRQG